MAEDAMFRRKKRVSTMEFVIQRLSDTFKKSSPACVSCGYDAGWILRIAGDGIGSLERMFCERCMTDAMLDAANWNCRVPSTL